MYPPRYDMWHHTWANIIHRLLKKSISDRCAIQVNSLNNILWTTLFYLVHPHSIYACDPPLQSITNILIAITLFLQTGNSPESDRCVHLPRVPLHLDIHDLFLLTRDSLKLYRFQHLSGWLVTLIYGLTSKKFRLK